MKELLNSKQNVKKAFMQKRHEFYLSLVDSNDLNLGNPQPLPKPVERKVVPILGINACNSSNYTPGGDQIPQVPKKEYGEFLSAPTTKEIETITESKQDEQPSTA